MRPAVFLDRDGTLIEEVGYLDRLERIALFPWSVDAVRLLARAGFAVVVVTNQAGVARAIIDEAFIEETHRFLSRKLLEGGACVNGWYYCPHHPEATVEKYRCVCECRKPRPGMIHAAVRDLDLDVSRSVVVGDRWLDVRLARAVGARAVLVKTGYGATEAEQPPSDVAPDAIAANLMAATTWILQHASTGSRQAD